MFRKLSTLFAILIASLAISATAIANNGAYVFNSGGAQVDNNCSASVPSLFWYSYAGSIHHLVINSAGHFNEGCEGWGPALPGGFVSGSGNNKFQIDPNGHWLLSINGN